MRLLSCLFALALLAGPAPLPLSADEATEAAKEREIATLQAEVTRLKAEVARLEALVARLSSGAGAPSATPVAPAPADLNQGQESSREQLKYLLYLYRAYKPPAGAPLHPALDGKRFVLYLVAVNQLERTNEGPLKMLFSPADRALAFPGTASYAGVTLEALAQRSFPALTSYAGRRNAVKELAITATSAPDKTALFGDLSFSDGALVGFLDGKVRYLNRQGLGLGPTDPIVAGPTSKSPLLQTLSSE
jgi:hypothetical protein